MNEEKQQASKHDWALFLTTDSQMNDETILEIYALRWGIEVYFKEAKQKLGFLKEQSRHYSAYIVPERKVNSHCYTWAVAINSKRRFKLISRY